MSRGVAYPLWERVDGIRKKRGWSKLELARRADLRPATIDNLQTSTRVPQPRIVAALAAAVDLDEDEAYRLAEGTVNDPDPSVRSAILRSERYNDRQKQLLLNLLDVLEEQAGGDEQGFDGLRAVGGG